MKPGKVSLVGVQNLLANPEPLPDDLARYLTTVLLFMDRGFAQKGSLD
jgi:hypothetical protein